ncbi:MAG TPA: hypothetical protein VFI13_05780 [Gemmatimonadales bacterium]|nr:hypothetical protein [Gemmatimonadales bacterium]
MSERLKRFRGGVVWPNTADTIDITPLVRADSVALEYALAHLAVVGALADDNTGFLSAILYRRVSGRPGPLFEALQYGGRRAELEMGLRPPLDPVTEAAVAGFVCDAGRQLADLEQERARYWGDRPVPPLYDVARWEVIQGWKILTPASRSRLRPFVRAGLPDEYEQLFGGGAE